jgi:DinB superfamily
MATHQQIDELLDKMAEERGRFLAQAAVLSEEDAARRPEGQTGEAEWCAKEQLAHLWEMERSYIAWVKAALRENGADLSGVRGEPTAIPIERARDHAVAELIDALKAERAGTVQFIRSLTPEQFDRTAKSPMFGDLTVLQWLRSFYRHDRMHTDQIAGRQSEYRPRYAGGAEPNRRPT